MDDKNNPKTDATFPGSISLPNQNLKTPQQILDSDTLRDYYDLGKILDKQVRTFKDQPAITKAILDYEEILDHVVKHELQIVERLEEIQAAMVAYEDALVTCTDLIKDLSDTDRAELEDYLSIRRGKYGYEQIMERLRK